MERGRWVLRCKRSEAPRCADGSTHGGRSQRLSMAAEVQSGSASRGLHRDGVPPGTSTS